MRPVRAAAAKNIKNAVVPDHRPLNSNLIFFCTNFKISYQPGSRGVSYRFVFRVPEGIGNAEIAFSAHLEPSKTL
jgi:hypothetical protein